MEVIPFSVFNKIVVVFESMKRDPVWKELHASDRLNFIQEKVKNEACPYQLLSLGNAYNKMGLYLTQLWRLKDVHGGGRNVRSN